MTSSTTARLDIVPTWRGVNEMLIQAVDMVPDDRMDWSPKPDLWSFRQVLVHLCEAREQWMTRAIDDGEPNEGFKTALDKVAIKDGLRSTWERVERSVGDQARMDAKYRDRWRPRAPIYDGHWVAFHLLEHDIHHRAEIYLYLALLGIETRAVDARPPSA